MRQRLSASETAITNLLQSLPLDLITAGDSGTTADAAVSAALQHLEDAKQGARAAIVAAAADADGDTSPSSATGGAGAGAGAGASTKIASSNDSATALRARVVQLEDLTEQLLRREQVCVTLVTQL